MTAPEQSNGGVPEEAIEMGAMAGRWRIEDSGERLSRFDALTRKEAIAHTAKRLAEFFKSEGEPCTTGQAVDEAAELVDSCRARPNVEQEQDGVCVTYVAASTQPSSPADPEDCERCGGSGRKELLRGEAEAYLAGGAPTPPACPDCHGTGKRPDPTP